ncbi:bifunctional folylpolyglutamate synthase/dihydrofolate synthase [Akkermansiaceae bacterium]|nr:bifunctional folylpolyglutamate synthase/dihydrofolate synthase [Akkermansiaceae bacterium]
MNYSESIEWLYTTQSFGVKLGLEGAQNLLRKFLAYPGHNVKVLHVAGTNGKGSVCAMMEMLIRGAGLRAAIFTSPHLVHFRERMKVNSIMITEEDCARYLTKLRSICEGLKEHPTFFEITLALAMRFFKDQGAEYIVLETGMGGRLDATTAVPSDISVITPIAMDHAAYLGDTLAEIAAEKAGIMHEGVPVLIAKQEEEAKEVLLEEANMRRSPVIVVDEPLVGYSIGIPGEHQKYNANLAVQAVHEVGISLNYYLVKESLKYVYWPGRFEQIESFPQPVILDGAHNLHATIALVETWKTEYPESLKLSSPVILFGAVDDKDVSGVLKILSKLSSKVIFTPLSSPRTIDADTFRNMVPDEVTSNVAENLEDAWELALAEKRPILVTGSLFLIGEWKAMTEKVLYQKSSQ